MRQIGVLMLLLSAGFLATLLIHPPTVPPWEVATPSTTVTARCRICEWFAPP